MTNSWSWNRPQKPKQGFSLSAKHDQVDIFLTSKGLFEKNKDGIFSKLIPEFNYPVERHALLSHPDGTIYYGGSDGLFSKPPDQDKFSQDPVLSKEVSGNVDSLLIDSKGTIYAGCMNGLFSKTPDQDKFSPDPIRWASGTTIWRMATDDPVYHILLDSKDTLYASCDEGFFIRPQGQKYFFPDPILTKEVSGGVSFIILDSKETIYASCGNGVFTKPFNQPFSPDPILTPENTVFPILFDSKDTLYAGSNTGIFSRPKNQPFSKTPLLQSAVSGYIYRLLLDSADTIYAHCNNGVFIKPTDQETFLPTKLNIPPLNKIIQVPYSVYKSLKAVEA